VKLTDFGVARIQDSGEATRTQGSMVGTLKYMAPEQVQGQKIDSRADLFSVGVVLYQLLTDKRPFDGDNDFSIIHQIIGHNPPPPSSINSRLPAAIDAVAARALAKSRDERFETARDFATALQSAIRRAEDVTVVPAANPLKQVETAGTGSRGGQSIAGAVTSPSTVTQEVELVYWKDIKDSADPEEFEAFLAKFPAGIYADLARRRLRKLTNGNTSPDQTILSGMRAPNAGADDEATRIRTGTQPSMVAPIPPVAAATTPPPAPTVEAAEAPEESQPAEDEASSVSEPPSEFPSTITLAPARSEPTRIEVSAPPKPAVAPTPASPTAQATRKKPPVALIAGVGGVIVLGIAAFAFMGRGSSQDETAATAAASAVASSATAASVAAVAVAPASSTEVPASAVAPTAAESEPKHPVAAKHAASRSAVRAKVAPSAPIAEPSRPAVMTPAPVREASRAAPPPSAPNPVEACKDRVFLGRELCLEEACNKPGARNHPLCVEWRRDKQLRENSRIGN
jgi:serine/threonine-protein kinase